MSDKKTIPKQQVKSDGYVIKKSGYEIFIWTNKEAEKKYIDYCKGLIKSYKGGLPTTNLT